VGQERAKNSRQSRDRDARSTHGQPQAETHRLAQCAPSNDRGCAERHRRRESHNSTLRAGVRVRVGGGAYDAAERKSARFLLCAALKSRRATRGNKNNQQTEARVVGGSRSARGGASMPCAGVFCIRVFYVDYVSSSRTPSAMLCGLRSLLSGG
jgi:hypothetical protein